MSSVLSRIKSTQGASTLNPIAPQPSMPVVPAASTSPLSKLSALKPASPVAAAPSLSITLDDVEQLGTDLSRQVGQTTNKIISKMTVGNFDELGKILVAVQAEAGKLDPASYQRGGIVGWFKNHFTDIKEQLTLQFSSAEKVFGDLEQKIAEHIRVHTDWIRDLEQLYRENYERYLGVIEVYKKLESWKENASAQLQAWPQIDPADVDSFLKLQARNDAETLLNRIKIRTDYFLRMKTLLENNGPKIRNQQETSRQTIATLKDIVEQVIPTVKEEFALFMQSLDSRNSQQFINGTRELVNKTLQISADTAKDAAVESAKNFNTAAISTETIQHIRTRMLETVTEVKRVQADADAKREQDATYIKQSQQQYYEECVKLGAIK